MALAIALSSCSSKKIKTAPELSRLEGKKVALVEVEGEETARNICEVALVNQLVRTGYFELIPKSDILTAKVAVDVDSSNPYAVAKKAGADFALQANVTDFEANEREGYNEEKVKDSQLEAETGDADTTRVYKVKRLDGHVAVELTFTDVRGEKPTDKRSAVAEKSGSQVAEAKTEAAHLQPRLRFLEQLANEAFHAFFEKYR